MNDEVFERILQNFDFIDGDYNILILDNDKTFVKTYNVFGEFKIDFNITELPVKPKDILNLPMDGWITDDGVLVKVTDPSVCEKIAKMLREGLGIEDEEEADEVRQQPEVKEGPQSTKTRKPAVEKWPIVEHRGETPIYEPILNKVEALMQREGKEVSITKISEIIYDMYGGQIERITADSYSYKYRSVILENGTKEVKIMRGPKAGLTRIGYVGIKAIYKEVVDKIIAEPENSIVDIVAKIEKVRKSTAHVYALSYCEWIEGHKPEQKDSEKKVPQSEETRADLEEREAITFYYNSEARTQKLTKTLLCYHNDAPIYDEIVLKILMSQNSEKIPNIQNIIQKEWSGALKATTATKYAYDYRAFINLISVDEVKKIYAILPESFNISDVRAHISTRFSQTEKRAVVAKLVIAMLIALFNCEEVSEGFRKKKGGSV